MEAEENGKKKKRRIFEKLIMGAIIGGAIGSVVGVSLKARRDKEKLLQQQGRQAEGLSPHTDTDKKKSITLRILRKAVGVFARNRKNDVKKIPTETEN